MKGEILNGSREKRIPKFCARDRGRSLLASSKTPWNPASYMQPNCVEKEFTDIEDVTKSTCLTFFLSKLLAAASHPVTGEPGGRGSQHFQRNGMADGDAHTNSSLGTMGRILYGPWRWGHTAKRKECIKVKALISLGKKVTQERKYSHSTDSMCCQNDNLRQEWLLKL